MVITVLSGQYSLSNLYYSLRGLRALAYPESSYFKELKMNIDTLFEYLKLTVPNTFNVLKHGSGIEVGVRAGTLYGSISSDCFWISDDNLIKLSTTSDGLPEYVLQIFREITTYKVTNESTAWRKVYAFEIPKDLQ